VAEGAGGRGPLARYIIRRLLQGIPLVFGVTIVCFLMIQLAPGDAAEFAISQRATELEIQRVRENLGLDLPWYEQYWKLLGNWAHLDFGNSWVQKRPVTDILANRAPRTMILLGGSVLISLLIAIPIGILSAVKQYSWSDNVVTIIAFIGISIPSFWLAIMFILLFSVKLHWLPTSGVGTPGEDFSLVDGLKHLAMPLMVLTLVRTAGWVRYLRSSMLEVLRQDYIRTAHAKGLHSRVVLLRHALRNALTPIITLLGLSLPDIFAGAIITEQIFNWQGLGQLAVTSALRRDTPVVMALVILTGVSVVIGNLLADICYRFVDPRIRF
jgi:peptide/nickel transport system permease protein